MTERLRGMDAAFLAFETPTSHMHVAQTCVFDPSTVPGGYSFERVRELVQDRLDLLPPFRRRLVEVPLGLSQPMWIEDPAFDLDNHLHRAAIPAPGGTAELAAFTAQVISEPLDRCQPLWEMHIVEGLEDGMVAAVAKMHHSTVDGISGAELTVSLLDFDPEPAPPTPPERRWVADRVPSGPERLLSGLATLGRQPRTAAGAVRHAVAAGIGIARRSRTPGASISALPFAAPPTPFNVSIGPRRRVAFTRLDLDDVKSVKDAFDTTVNDVVLATCAGALRTYLSEHDHEPTRPLVAAVPVSKRTPDQRGTMGNRVSGMLVELATTTDDPAERLAAIAESARQAKAQDQLIPADTISELAELMPPVVGKMLGRAVARSGITHRVRPVFNVIISSFPGPPVPLYCAGARLVAAYPLGPVFDGGALNITLQSYLDGLHVGLVADDRAVPELDDLARQLPEALAHLTKLAA